MKNPLKRKFYWLRTAAINTHVNQGLKHGVIQWLLKRHPFMHLILLQESHNEAALNAALPKGWDHWPKRQPGEDTGQEGNEAGNYIAYNTNRLTFQGGVNWDIGFGKWPRRMVGAIFFDKKTHRLLFVSSHHPDPLNPRDWSNAHTHNHIRQVGTFVRWHQSRLDEHAGHVLHDLHISGGDTQEVVAVLRDEDSALNQFGELGMVPTSMSADSKHGPNRLMNIFTNHRAWVGWHKSYDTGIKNMDHEVIVCGIKVPVGGL